ncbi:MAG: NapC/NirT family cytochrome c [Gammaproteobacteria bacterium]|nr:NapC/NirT family cytochrome c [Gammaproteobacteria bacterium]
MPNCPSKKTVCISLVIFLAGAFALIALNGFFHYTNRMEFCVSCHSMQINFEEYKQTLHYKNSAGIQATCADCHVPKDFFPKLYAKIYAAKDVYHEIMGTVDTKEKFDARRWKMANAVWDKMRASDSRECRSCHDYANMDISAQDRMARKKHTRAPTEGKTCIDCHTGITHTEPMEPDNDIIEPGTQDDEPVISNTE